MVVGALVSTGDGGDEGGDDGGDGVVDGGDDGDDDDDGVGVVWCGDAGSWSGRGGEASKSCAVASRGLKGYTVTVSV